MNVTGDADASAVNATTRWVAPNEMVETAPEVSEQERQEVLERIGQTLVPPVTQ